MKHAARITIALALLLSSLIFSQGTNSKSINPDLLTREWGAKWITAPDATANGYGVYLFRKTIDLTKAPTAFVVHVSADNRYKLYVNEKLVSIGPARGDLFYWNYETVDLAPYLGPGKNIIAAKVWNDGDTKPEAQISWRTGFIIQGDTTAEQIVNSNKTWKCMQDDSYHSLESREIAGYYVAGPGEFIDMNKSIRGWEKAAFDDTSWKNAALAYWSGGAPKGIQDAPGWMLVPSAIPQMELTPQRLQSLREATGVQAPDSFPATPVALNIPAKTKATLLLDNGCLTNAYINLQFSQGHNASISLKYAESLYKPSDSTNTRPSGKGNRNEVKGKIFLGRKDSLISDGTSHQIFNSLYWRTYRYIELSVETKDEPLVIEDIYGTFTGYPFQWNADLKSEKQELQKVLEIGWRTARLCALETYMDCPYYEQLQYIGDTRIQALVSFYNSGDDRLVRNALNQMDHSRIAEGLTLSRHPSATPQIIPTFSLWYIGMLHDYWRYRPDSEFVKEKITGTRQILEFFKKYQSPDGSLQNVPYWNFTDWVMNRPGWVRGVAPTVQGGSSVLDLQLLLAYQTAAELESRLGMEAHALEYSQRAEQLIRTIRSKYWDETKSMFADTPGKNSYSQHANTLAILTGSIAGKDASLLAKKILADSSMAPASIYFRYYLHQALIKAGLGEDYLNWLGKWQENMALGMTTWAENYDVENARSDCHAWGSSPNIELFRTVLGIDSDAPGFAKVKIKPCLGALQKIGGEIPHPQGKISVHYELKKEKWEIKIQLPGSTTGTLIWKNHSYLLKAGENKIEL
jgi:alpha-L-rhamnosidase